MREDHFQAPRRRFGAIRRNFRAAIAVAIIAAVGAGLALNLQPAQSTSSTYYYLERVGDGAAIADRTAQDRRLGDASFTLGENFWLRLHAQTSRGITDGDGDNAVFSDIGSGGLVMYFACSDSTSTSNAAAAAAVSASAVGNVAPAYFNSNTDGIAPYPGSNSNGYLIMRRAELKAIQQSQYSLAAAPADSDKIKPLDILVQLRPANRAGTGPAPCRRLILTLYEELDSTTGFSSTGDRAAAGLPLRWLREGFTPGSRPDVEVIDTDPANAVADPADPTRTLYAINSGKSNNIAGFYKNDGTTVSRIKLGMSVRGSAAKYGDLDQVTISLKDRQDGAAISGVAWTWFTDLGTGQTPLQFPFSSCSANPCTLTASQWWTLAGGTGNLRDDAANLDTEVPDLYLGFTVPASAGDFAYLDISRPPIPSQQTPGSGSAFTADTATRGANQRWSNFDPNVVLANHRVSSAGAICANGINPDPANFQLTDAQKARITEDQTNKYCGALAANPGQLVTFGYGVVSTDAWTPTNDDGTHYVFQNWLPPLTAAASDSDNNAANRADGNLYTYVPSRYVDTIRFASQHGVVHKYTFCPLYGHFGADGIDPYPFATSAGLGVPRERGAWAYGRCEITGQTDRNRLSLFNDGVPSDGETPIYTGGSIDWAIYSSTPAGGSATLTATLSGTDPWGASYTANQSLEIDIASSPPAREAGGLIGRSAFDRILTAQLGAKIAQVGSDAFSGGRLPPTSRIPGPLGYYLGWIQYQDLKLPGTADADGNYAAAVTFTASQGKISYRYRDGEADKTVHCASGPGGCVLNLDRGLLMAQPGRFSIGDPPSARGYDLSRLRAAANAPSPDDGTGVPNAGLGDPVTPIQLYYEPPASGGTVEITGAVHFADGRSGQIRGRNVGGNGDVAYSETHDVAIASSAVLSNDADGQLAPGQAGVEVSAGVMLRTDAAVRRAGSDADIAPGWVFSRTGDNLNGFVGNVPCHSARRDGSECDEDSEHKFTFTANGRVNDLLRDSGLVIVGPATWDANGGTRLRLDDATGFNRLACVDAADAGAADTGVLCRVVDADGNLPSLSVAAGADADVSVIVDVRIDPATDATFVIGSGERTATDRELFANAPEIYPLNLRGSYFQRLSFSVERITQLSAISFDRKPGAGGIVPTGPVRIRSDADVRLALRNENGQASQLSAVSAITLTVIGGGTLSGLGCTNASSCTISTTSGELFDAAKTSPGKTAEIDLSYTAPAKPGDTAIRATVVGNDGSTFTETLDLTISGSARELAVGGTMPRVHSSATDNDDRDKILIPITAKDGNDNPAPMPRNAAATVSKVGGGPVGSHTATVKCEGGDNEARLKCNIEIVVTASASQPLASGAYTATVTGTGIGSTEASFAVGGPADALSISVPDPLPGLAQGFTATVGVVDAAGVPVADGTWVAFSTTATGGGAPSAVVTSPAADDVDHDGDADTATVRQRRAATRNGEVSANITIVGNGVAVLTASTGFGASLKSASEALDTLAAALPTDATGAVGRVLEYSTPGGEPDTSAWATYQGAGTTTADDLLGHGEAPSDARIIWLWNGVEWIRYGEVGGVALPGSQPFVILPDDTIWFGD